MKKAEIILKTGVKGEIKNWEYNYDGDIPTISHVINGEIFHIPREVIKSMKQIK